MGFNYVPKVGETVWVELGGKHNYVGPAYCYYVKKGSVRTIIWLKWSKGENVFVSDRTDRDNNIIKLEKIEYV